MQREIKETAMRRKIRVSGYPQWVVAEKIGVHPNTLCIWVRSKANLTATRKLKIERALQELRDGENKSNERNSTGRK